MVAHHLVPELVFGKIFIHEMVSVIQKHGACFERREDILLLPGYQFWVGLIGLAGEGR